MEDTATTVATGSGPDTPLAEAAGIPSGPEGPDGAGAVTGRAGTATDACARGIPPAAASRPSEPEFGEDAGAGRSEEPNNGGNVTPGTVATPDRPAATNPRQPSITAPSTHPTRRTRRARLPDRATNTGCLLQTVATPRD
ncbi:hypothetical protein [Protofrankia coriariae]|uniref:Uncharacterized protein n=1 Tax=Protofrankia coriariae TaxID=1562887 RepID=A0ABR5EZ00_9ACTN|nr:hypothetical protein [Protofrankia coriariae]KLL09618.1 hypothetical protein FrCorBMG51_23630 [Protofrankia coriariae]